MALSSSARSISLPVMSAACTMRCLEWPPSLARCNEPQLFLVNSHPNAMSLSTASFPSAHTTSTASWSHKKSPAIWVSLACSSAVSSGSITAEMPPWA